VEPARIAEDERSFRSRECDGTAVDQRAELFLGRIIFPEWTPRPELVELTSRCTTRDVFERPRLLVDIDEVEERLQEVAIVEVAMPALRRTAICLVRRRCVPEVDVFELLPKSEIRVGEIEQPRLDSQAQPRVVEPELDAVRVFADNKFLPGTATERRIIPLGLLGKTSLRRRAKLCRVRFQ